MSQPDALRTVARELAALAGADRRAILGALDADDRSRILAMLRERDPVDRTAVPAGNGVHSAWFEGLIASAGGGSGTTMTVAARTALIDAIGSNRSALSRGPGRSLLEAAGGLLGSARVR